MISSLKSLKTFQKQKNPFFACLFNFHEIIDDDEEEDAMFNYEPSDEEDEREKGPALDLYGTDLTVLASQGKLDECFGREEELLELMEILVRRQKN